MWEAFPLQMNDFDRYLEIELRHILDPVVVRRPPARKGRTDPAAAPAPLVIEGPAPQAIAAVEPVVVAAFPAASVRPL